ncbi:MAG TPA: class D sortase [bacterium]|nr:class D sortase [bacterium]
MKNRKPYKQIKAVLSFRINPNYLFATSYGVLNPLSSLNKFGNFSKPALLSLSSTRNSRNHTLFEQNDIENRKKRNIKGILAKTFLLLFSVLMIISITVVLYFNYETEIRLFRESIQFQRIGRNSVFAFYSNIISESSTREDFLTFSETDLESISAEDLARYQNDGNVIQDVKKYKTVLKIKSVNIDGRVFDGNDSSTLHKGLWHFPLSPGPGSKGNFVVIAHRYAKMPPATDTFFNLDKVKVGDQIEIYQSTGNFTYTVTEKKIIDKNDRSVLEQTSDYRITLITCTPLWSDEQRLIIIGKLDKIKGTI